MKSEPTAHTASAELFAPPSNEPSPSQTTAAHQDTQTTPSKSTPIPAPPAIPPKPRVTRLEQLRQVNATLDEYFPVIGNILEKAAVALVVGLLTLVAAVVFVGFPIFWTGIAVLKAWRG